MTIKGPFTTPRRTNSADYLINFARYLVNDKYKMAMEFAEESIIDTRDTLDKLSVAIEQLKAIDYVVSINDVPPIDLGLLPTPPVIPGVSAPSTPVPPEKIAIPRIDISDLNLPSIDDLIMPDALTTINAGDNTYTSPLLSAIKARLMMDVVNGGVGIDPDVEMDIYNREYERNLQELADAKNRVISDWSKRGLPLPDSTLVNALNMLELEYSNKRNELSRDIRIKQAELAQHNTQFAMQQAVQLESILINFTNAVSQRILDASRSMVEMQIAATNAIISKYRAMVDIYTAVVNARIEEAKGIAQVYMAEVEAYRAHLAGEMARMDAELKTFFTELDVYKVKAGVFSDLTKLNLGIFEVRMREAMERANVYLKDAEIKLQNHRAIEGMKIEGLKSLANTVANFVSGALASVSAGVSVGAKGDVGEQFTEYVSDQYQESVTE